MLNLPRAVMSQQAWSTFRTDTTSFLQAGEMFSVRFDSSEAIGLGDTFWYSYGEVRATQGLPGQCTLEQNDTSWTGVRVRMNANFHHFLYNKWGDSIRFIGALALGDTVHMYSFPNGNYFRAVCISDQSETLIPPHVEGTKTFRIDAKTASGADTTHAFDNKLFKITFSHGFSLAYNWSLFPTDTTEIWIAGAPADSLGFGNTDTRTIFNIQPGNEFHYSIRDEFCGFSGCRIEDIREKRFYLTRDTSATGDTITLSYQHILINYIDDPITGLDTVYAIDTQQQLIVFSQYTYLDGFNREDFHADSIIGTLCNCPTQGWSLISFSDSFGPRPRKRLYLDLELDSANACLYPSANTGYDSTFVEYGDGLGLTRFRDTDNSNQWHDLEMVYYQKGIEVWGEPIDFSEVTGISAPDMGALRLYPNPATDFVRLDLPSTGTTRVELLDAEGRLILSRAMSESRCTIELGDLARGFYLVRVTSQQAVSTARFVKL
jgi:hypothetical protein